MKKLFYPLFLLCLMFLLPVTAHATVVASGTCGADGDNLTWELDDAGTLTISGTGAMKYWSQKYSVPWDGNRSAISSVVIQNGVTNVGRYAFYRCSNLSSVTIPDSVTDIDYHAFYECSSLSSVIIPDGVTSISDDAFSGCSNLSSITIPNALTSIGDGAFSGCSKLSSSITIPNGVTYIGGFAFYGCSSLSTSVITIPSGVTYIGYNPFAACRSISNIYVQEGNTYFSSIDGVLVSSKCIDGMLISSESSQTIVSYPAGREGAYSVPDTIKRINGYAFYGAKLSKITLSESVTSIADHAFEECANLAEAIFTNHLSGIGMSAFSNCSSLTDIVLPGTLSSIGQSSFYKCTGLKNVVIANGATYIGEYMFSGCSNLENVVIPNTVTRINKSAFESCNIKNIAIPKSVTQIGDRAFYVRANMRNVYYGGTAEEWEAISIGSSNSRLTAATMHFASSGALSGSCGDGVTWRLVGGTLTVSGSGSMTDWTGPESVPWFEQHLRITSVVIQQGPVNIGSYAFYECINLSNVTISDTVYFIGDYAFYGCTNLTGILKLKKTITLSDTAFKGCPSVTVQKSLESGDSGGGTSTSIPERAHYNDNSLRTVELPFNIARIEKYAYYGCAKLKVIQIPSSVVLIDEYAFEGCLNLTDVYYEGTRQQWQQIEIRAHNDPLLNATIHYGYSQSTVDSGMCGPDLVWVWAKGELYIRGSGAMYGWTSSSAAPWDGRKSNVSSVTIYDGASDIGAFAFQGCRMSSATIPVSVARINKGAFKLCSALTDVYFGGTKAQWRAIPIADENAPLFSAVIHCTDGDILPEGNGAGQNGSGGNGGNGAGQNGNGGGENGNGGNGGGENGNASLSGGENGNALPYTGAPDYRGAYALTFCLSALCAAGAYRAGMRPDSAKKRRKMHG